MGKWILVAVVVLCAFTGVAVGESATESIAAANNQTTVSSSATVNGTAEQVSDCDLVDVNGHNNTVSVNITHNATDDSSMTIQYHCGTDAETLDHDLIDVDGTNNTVTVTMQVVNTTIGFSAHGDVTDNNGLRVALGCEAGVSKDCDGVDINGHNNSVRLIIENATERTVHEFGSNSSNVSWRGGENSTSEGNSGDNSANTTIRSTDGESPSNDLLDMVADAIPVVGAITLFILGSALLVKRDD